MQQQSNVAASISIVVLVGLIIVLVVGFYMYFIKGSQTATPSTATTVNTVKTSTSTYKLTPGNSDTEINTDLNGAELEDSQKDLDSLDKELGSL